MPPVMPYVSAFTGDASFYPPLRKKGRKDGSVMLHRAIVDPANTVEDVLRIASEALPMDADNLATSIHKIAKLRRSQDVQHSAILEDPRWTRLMDEVIENGTAFIWPLRLLSLAAWAASSIRDRRVLPLLFDVCAKRVSLGSVPQDLSSIAWALATARMRDQSAQHLLKKISEESQARVDEFIPQDIAMCAWSFAKVAYRDNKLLALFGDAAYNRFSELNGQNVSNIVWSLATIREMHEPLLAVVSNTKAETIKGMGPQEFSNIAWSYATMAKVSEKLFRRTAARVVSCARTLDSQHLANVTWAFAKISHRDDGLFYVLSREAMRGDRPINPLNLANFAWAFASAGWHGEMSTRRIGLRDPEFFEWIANKACELIQNFMPQNCSNLVWAYATMRVPNEKLFRVMSEQVQAWMIRDFDPQHLSNVLWSYAKLQIRDEALFECAADAIQNRGIDYLSRTPQNISNVVWAYGVVVVKPPSLLDAIEKHINNSGPGSFYSRLTEVTPLGKSSRAQIAMTVLSLHRLGLNQACWILFDRLAADGVQAGGEAYSNWLFVSGSNNDIKREIDVWEQMARTSHTRGLQMGVYNCCVIRSLKLGDVARAIKFLELMDRESMCNVLSEQLRTKCTAAAAAKGLPPPPVPTSEVRDIDWRRREKEEHEWVTNSLGFSLRLNKIEYYKEVGTLHYILKHGERENVPVIHRAIETFIREQELWLKLAGDEKGAVLDKVLAMHGAPRLFVEIGLYVGYSSTRMASQLKNWGGKVISIEVDPYHAAISRNTIELAGLSDVIDIWVGHSENLIPRLAERLPKKSIDVLFFDQQGTKMHIDLERIVRAELLSDEAIIVGDNVLRPGSPQFMYWTCTAGPYETQVVSLKEYSQDTVEDWMSISYHEPHSANASKPMIIPEAVEQLAHETDGIRWQSVEMRVSTEQWDSHSQRMRREFVNCGIVPPEIIPYQDASGRSQVDLMPRGQVVRRSGAVC